MPESVATRSAGAQNMRMTVVSEDVASVRRISKPKKRFHSDQSSLPEEPEVKELLTSYQPQLPSARLESLGSLDATILHLQSHMKKTHIFSV